MRAGSTLCISQKFPSETHNTEAEMTRTTIAKVRHVDVAVSAPAALGSEFDADLEQSLNQGHVSLRRAKTIQARRNAA